MRFSLEDCTCGGQDGTMGKRKQKRKVPRLAEEKRRGERQSGLMLQMKSKFGIRIPRKGALIWQNSRMAAGKKGSDGEPAREITVKKFASL